jgi:HD-GYP domain-containing protein (c-di-GMP phosphodiesterase class II)
MSTATLSPKRGRAGTPAGFEVIPTSAFRCLERTGVDLYVNDGTRSEPVLLCSKNFEVSTERLERLVEQSTCRLLVRSGDFARVGRILQGQLDSLLTNSGIPSEERIALLQTAVATEIETCYRLVSCEKFVAAAQRIAKQLCSLVYDSPVLPRPLFQLLRHDAATFTHVTNVTTYAVLLAKELGTFEPDEVQQIAVAALLHDVGKRHVPVEILNKPAKLTPSEREIIERHPRDGYIDLLEQDYLTEPQRLVAYQHHERIDGRGYPVGIDGDEIHPWAKLTAVIDVFEALTGERPYRSPLSFKDALEYSQEFAGTQFDEEMVQCFVQMMSP